MKKIFLFILIFLISLSMPVWAVKESSPPGTGKEASPPGKEKKEEKTTITEEKIKALKERVATKVAELRKRQKKALIGQIKSLEEESFILETKKGDETVMTDEKTRIYRIEPRRGKVTIKLSDLQVGEKVSVFGRKDNLSEELTAKFIIARTPSLNINGIVTEIDKPGGTITVKTPSKEVFVVDIEVYTKTRSWVKGEGLKKSGFSKILIDDRVHIIGVENKKEKKRMTAHRVLVLPGEVFRVTQEKEATPTVVVIPSPTISE